MKAIQIGRKYEIYDDNLQTHDFLPAKVYTVQFEQMSGFHLLEHAPLLVEEKIYGIHQKKVGKVMNAFENFNRNLGVILSGSKGIGKSVFAKLLAMRAVEAGIPVIIVERYTHGIAPYIESIEQEAMVLFDEFDKTFGNIRTKDGEPDPQAGLLSLFDGTAMGKKLFVVTCNELHGLNDYLVNRPGRFHYHFRFEYPSDGEIREYLRDKLAKEYWPQIDAVAAFSRRVDLNYDCLRSIAFELNNGSDFTEAIRDLNIINMRNVRYDITLHFEDGRTLINRGHEMDMFSPGETENIWLQNNSGDFIVEIAFDPSECKYDYTRGFTILEADAVSIVNYDDDYDETAAIKKTKPTYLAVTRSRGKDIHYAV